MILVKTYWPYFSLYFFSKFPSRWSPAFKELCRSSRLESTKQLAQAVQRSAKKPNVFVSVSGVGYYPPDRTAVYDESGKKGDDWLAQLSVEWEAEAQASGIRTVILRYL